MDPSKRLIRQKVHLELQNRIVIGELKPKEFLREKDIASEFKCSLASVREALQKLEEEGLVERIPFVGPFVTALSSEELKDLYEYRKLIELNALDAFIRNVTRTDLQVLEDTIDLMRQAASANDIRNLLSYDMFFHKYIVKKSGKTISLKLWSRIDLHIRRFMAFTYPLYLTLIETAENHVPLLEALEKGDPDIVKEVFTKHIIFEPAIEKLNL
ncbi:GntR family transcriptional regulator [bacterium LRH843]|nr:GntR family transcriptional regulator [bacterium LRH843]